MFKLPNIFSKKRRTLRFLIGIALFLSILPSYFAEAQSLDPVGDFMNSFCPGWNTVLALPALVSCGIQYIISIPIRIPLFLTVFLVGLIALGGGLVNAMITAVTSWIIAISVSIGITPGNPLTPEIINIGWTFTRDFANMFFILALALIGLSTILRIKDYEAKKALPTLIMIALLINFTPVIVGFIVDMGNILTNFFLTRAAATMGAPVVINMAFEYIVNSFMRIFLIDGNFFTNFGVIIGDFVALLVYGAMLIAFFFLSSYVYIMITIIFFARIIVLWILMILAPIAFLSRVFSQKKLPQKLFPKILGWEGWWTELIEWVIVGIPLGFFIYLSSWVAMNSSSILGIFQGDELRGTMQRSAASIQGFGTYFTDLITAILVPAVSLAILYKGYLISKETAPEFARKIYAMGEKGVKMVIGVGKMMATKGMGKMADSMGGGLETIAKKQRDIAERPGASRGDRIIDDLIGKPAALAGSILKSYSTRTRGFKLPEGFDKADLTEQLKHIDDPRRSKEEKAQLLARMAKSGNLAGADEEVLGKAFGIATSVMNDPHCREYAKRIFKVMPKEMKEDTLLKLATSDTERFELEGEITRMVGDRRIEETMEVGEKEKLRVERDQAASAIFMKRINPEEMARMAISSSKDPGVIDGIVRFGKPKHLAKLTEKFGDEFAGTYIEAVKAKGGAQWLIENNPEPLIYMTGHLAQEKGLYIEGLPKRKEIMKEAAKFRKQKIKERIREREEGELIFKETPERLIKLVEKIKVPTHKIPVAAEALALTEAEGALKRLPTVRKAAERARARFKRVDAKFEKETSRTKIRPRKISEITERRAEMEVLVKAAEIEVEEALAKTLSAARKAAEVTRTKARLAEATLEDKEKAERARETLKSAGEALKAVEARRVEARREAKAAGKIFKETPGKSYKVLKTKEKSSMVLARIAEVRLAEASLAKRKAKTQTEKAAAAGLMKKARDALKAAEKSYATFPEYKAIVGKRIAVKLTEKELKERVKALVDVFEKLEKEAAKATREREEERKKAEEERARRRGFF